MQFVHHRSAAILMKPQPLPRCQAALTRFGIVEIHLTQHLQHIAAFIGEVLRHIHELSTAPALLHLPGMGSLRVYAPGNASAALHYTAQRKGTAFVAITFPAATAEHPSIE